MQMNGMRRRRKQWPDSSRACPLSRELFARSLAATRLGSVHASMTLSMRRLKHIGLAPKTAAVGFAKSKMICARLPTPDDRCRWLMWHKCATLGFAHKFRKAAQCLRQRSEWKTP